MSKWGRRASLAALAVLAQTILWVQAGRVQIADYEIHYGRTDAPAYHMTPVKRLVRTVAGADLIHRRRAVSFIRLMGLMAFLQLCRRHFGAGAAFWSLLILLVLPPTTVYLVRLDSWMDGVSFSLMSLYFLSRGRTEGGKILRVWDFLGGAFTTLAIDAKLTAALTMIPAVILFLWTLRADPRRLIWMLIGAAVGFGAAQPEWILHPSHALAHVNYWREANETMMTQSVSLGYATAALFSSIPVSLWIMAGWGCTSARKDRATAAVAILGLVPIVFFTFYRTVDPDGVRHLFMVMPCVAVLAAGGFEHMGRIPKICFVGLCLAEMVLREFPKF